MLISEIPQGEYFHYPEDVRIPHSVFLKLDENKGVSVKLGKILNFLDKDTGTLIKKPVNLAKLTRESHTFCCEFMEGQFKQLPCADHGNRCPDCAIQQSDTHGRWYLVAENASYSFKFCPSCGKEIPKDRQIDEMSDEEKELRLKDYFDPIV